MGRAILAAVICTLPLWSGQAVASIDFSRLYREDHRLAVDSTQVLIATHLSHKFDTKGVSKLGSQQAIRRASSMGYGLVYFLEDPSPDIPTEEMKRWEEIFGPSPTWQQVRSVLEPYVNRQWLRSFFPPETVPELYVMSGSGNHRVELSDAKEVYFVGGFIEACLGFSMDRVLENFALSSAPSLKVFLVSDGIYLNGCGIGESDSGVLTLSGCQARLSPEDFQDFLLNNVSKGILDRHGIAWTMNGARGPASRVAGRFVEFVVIQSSEMKVPRAGVYEVQR